MKILALGPAGTNGHEAAHQILRRINEKSLVLPGETTISNISIDLCDSHATVFKRAVDERCYCVVPIENSIKGLVDDTIRGFWLRYPLDRTVLSVIGEVNMPIEHVLVMRQGEVLMPTTPVLSHPQALAQCSESLKSLGLIRSVPTNSTAGAGEMVAREDRHGLSAAIVSPFASTVYRLQVIKNHMEDIRGNVTRFHLLGHRPCPVMDGGKTALIFWTKDQPGALWSALGAIATNGVNMTSVHSLPLGTPGEYAFYIEFDEHSRTRKGFDIMEKLTNSADRILWLGSFPQESAILERKVQA